jgi:hypothetical protein
MRIHVTTVFGFLLLCTLTSAAEKKIYAPLPDKVVAAKTVFFINESGTARFGDDLYRQIKAWNRWDVVTDRGKADLILVLSPSDTACRNNNRLSDSIRAIGVRDKDDRCWKHADPALAPIRHGR